MKQYKYSSVLTIAGSDSGGGAGIQADLKTFSALGCYGTSAITAVTVQNTMGVKAIHSIPADLVEAQIRSVMDDIAPTAIKIGMVHSAELALAISLALKTYPLVPVIFDPVMVATSGDQLIKDNTLATLRTALFPISTLLTPNLDEASLLVNRKITDLSDMRLAAKDILQTGCFAVLLKGGHLKGENVYDIYLDRQGNETVFESVYIASKNLHGTGCTLSAAIAAHLSLGQNMENAIEKSREYVFHAILHGKEVKTGNGNGPLNHFFNPQKLAVYEMD